MKTQSGRAPVLGSEMTFTLCACFTLAKSLQSCLTLCDVMDCSQPGSSVHGILQARNWSGLPFPFPGDLPDPGIEPGCLMSTCFGRRVLYH